MNLFHPYTDLRVREKLFPWFNTGETQSQRERRSCPDHKLRVAGDRAKTITQPKPALRNTPALSRLPAGADLPTTAETEFRELLYCKASLSS